MRPPWASRRRCSRSRAVGQLFARGDRVVDARLSSSARQDPETRWPVNDQRSRVHQWSVVRGHGERAGVEAAPHQATQVGRVLARPGRGSRASAAVGAAAPGRPPPRRPRRRPGHCGRGRSAPWPGPPSINAGSVAGPAGGRQQLPVLVARELRAEGGPRATDIPLAGASIQATGAHGLASRREAGARPRSPKCVSQRPRRGRGGSATRRHQGPVPAVRRSAWSGRAAGTNWDGQGPAGDDELRGVGAELDLDLDALTISGSFSLRSAASTSSANESTYGRTVSASCERNAKRRSRSAAGPRRGAAARSAPSPRGRRAAPASPAVVSGTRTRRLRQMPVQHGGPPARTPADTALTHR
ncbi:hypothetical protein SALBM135S_04102 [Streptomyces alboniger]